VTSLSLLLLLLDASAPSDTAALVRLVSLVAAGLLVVVLRQTWGAGNHLDFAPRVQRDERSRLPADFATLLRGQRDARHYGNLAADIVDFKRYGGHYEHRQRSALVDELRSRASTPPEEAFSLGCLGHLASDTSAHDHFVPDRLPRYARTKGLGHPSWEMRADRWRRGVGRLHDVSIAPPGESFLEGPETPPPRHAEAQPHG